MTQELVLGVLLSGLMGLLWIMKTAIGENKHAAGQAHEPESSGNSDDMPHGERALKHQATAT